MRKVAGALAALCVAGCVSPYVATPYDRASSSVQSIAVVDDASRRG